MKKRYLLLILIVLFLCNNRTNAQLAGGNAFLQGTYLEIGELNNGAFGVCAGVAPAGYHSFCVGCSYGDGLAMVYDYGHDGWAAGTPPSFGDYAYPGTPFEGWEMQVNGVRSQAMQGSIGTGYAAACPCPYTGGLAGSIGGYSSSGGITTAGWSGTCSGLTVSQETRVDINSSWVVVTTTFANPTGTAIPGIYYLRTTDPDNDETHSGNFSTTNTVIYQNDLDHRVLVNSVGTSYPNAYLALGTKDCRAKAFWYSSWPIDPTGHDLATVWSSGAGVGTSGITVGSSTTNDWAIGLVYNLGTLAPGASTVISYAYIFDGNIGIDSAFPDPQMVVMGDTIPDAPPQQITYDTINVCSLNPLITFIPVDIIYGLDKDWTNSTWTWSPGTGLTTVTGVINGIDLTALTGPITYVITGTDSATGMKDCANRVFMLTIIPCHTAHNNSPCYGDTLFVGDRGDSLGATYAWTGPGGFTSTKQNFFIYPATFADSGMYRVIKSISGVHDTDSTRVIIHPLPVAVVSSNSPLCADAIDTLHLSVTPFAVGDTFKWTGPGGFTSSLEFPTISGFTPPAIGLGTYTVVVTTIFGCKDTVTTVVDTIPRPSAPLITGPNYCQYQPFVPFTTIPAASATISILWYPSGTGGIGTTTASTINTAIAGYDTVWASQKIGSCESPRGDLVVHVTTRPPSPVVTGPMQYCQYIGPVVDLTASHTASGIVYWYTGAAGGTGTLTEPLPSINIAGATTYYVTQVDSGCESLRTPVTITIHPKPDTPVITTTNYCQFNTPRQVIATVSGAGDAPLWYGPGVTVGSPTAPTPTTDTQGVIIYYVTETTVFGCVSDSAMDVVHITVKPQPPVVKDISYCQFFRPVPPLNAEVDSAGGSTLNWYDPTADTLLYLTPVPRTDTAPGNYTWFVRQTILGCPSDSTPLTVTIIYKPVFEIAASQPYVCQFDSITLAYIGPDLFAPGYTWTLPEGAIFVKGTHSYDSMIIVKFDTVTLNNYVTLTASDDSGKCKSDTSIRIKIVTQPTAYPNTKSDVCLGDTVTLGLSAESADAYTYTWLIDNVLMGHSLALNIVASNSNSGGPYSISWLDAGHHTIVVTSYSQEGCKSLPWYDTINVHTLPDAAFSIPPGKLCIDDSVLFTANSVNYSYSYEWAPSHYFNNINTPTIWGKVEQAQSMVTLTVTDPFGCVGKAGMEIDPEPCCTVFIPNAFTPNGDGYNNYFRPLFNGYHKFHEFRIANRWGQTVFESTDDQAKWDGNCNGVPQDMGTYYYYLKYDCGGKTQEQKGDVTLLR